MSYSPSAFPVLERGGNGLELSDSGMELLDYFAAKAMAASLAPSPTGKTWIDPDQAPKLAEFSYLVAQAMLDTRKKLSPNIDEAADKLQGFMDYFPKAKNAHEGYRAIEALENQRDELLAIVEKTLADNPSSLFAMHTTAIIARIKEAA
jgi:hypothetical protein